eukprot:Partr_v1_DN28927_c4_g1_i15_m25266 putative methyltransferase
MTGFKSTVDAQEVAKFSRLAAEWWNPTGSFRLLHAMNPPRIDFVQQTLASRSRSLADSSVLDVGCGGGILSQSLSRLGARKVTGIDASHENVLMATAAYQSHVFPHQKASGAVTFRHSTTDDLREEFDVVCAMEMIEHVADPQALVDACHKLTRPDGGLFIVSTLNRTLWSYLTSILMAERVVGLVPSGTHDYGKFLSPDELDAICTHGRKFSRIGLGQLTLNPISMKWSLGRPGLGPIVNYIAAYERVG